MADSSPSPATTEPNQPETLNPNPSTPSIPPPPPPQLLHPMPPMFRPQFSVHPPGVGPIPSPGMMPYPGQQMPPNPALRPPFTPTPNGFHSMPPGIPFYGSPFNPMGRPVLIPRPQGVLGAMQPVPPPFMGIRGPLPAVNRPPVIASVAPVEKPQTTVYVGKIASTVENDFILAVLQLCGPIKSWKRAQDPSTGAPKGFGFCEFETAEGVLRALRLLSKLNIDGQELMMNVNQATKEYLERYAAKKAESLKKLKEAESEGAEKGDEGTPSAEKKESPKPLDEVCKKEDKDEGSDKKTDSVDFGTVNDEDREADREVMEKLAFMIEERLKNNPLPPPPPLPAADSNALNSEQPAESKDGDSNEDDTRNGEVKKDENEVREMKLSSERETPEASSPDRRRKDDRRSRDRERDKRDKERELERYEREREQERSRREREREYKNKEDDRRYKARVKEWESREREKEYLRKQEREKEKEREYRRKQEVLDQELEDDDGDSKKRRHKSVRSDERRRRIKEKKDDLADRLKEEEEVAEAAKRRTEEELLRLKEEEKDASEPLPGTETDGVKADIKAEAVEMTLDGDSGTDNRMGDAILQNGNGDESVMETISTSDTQQNNNISSKKLGFGLVGSGKRTAVTSVFNQEEDEDAHKDKKMRPLVPIDYSTEELQAVQTSTPVAPPSNLAAAAEFAKQISGVAKEDRADVERERSKRSHDRSSHRDKNGSEREREREQRHDKKKPAENQKLMDAKQLIDMIPKTKEELFSYKINWAVYDKNELHDRMKPWISKKITEFLGEEEPSLVEYIVSSTQEHVDAAQMLENLKSILDDEAEMFVLKMWRMLIFEIKKIETGLAQKAKS